MWSSLLEQGETFSPASQLLSSSVLTLVSGHAHPVFLPAARSKNRVSFLYLANLSYIKECH